MKNSKMAKHFSVLMIILAVALGCKFLSANKAGETTEEPKTNKVRQINEKTKITKEVLQQRLIAKGIKIATENRNDKPNPLTLQLKFENDNKSYKLNSESYKSFEAAATKLKEIFKMREAEGVFIEGTNDVYKKITLPAYQTYVDEYNSKNIYVEDFEKLVDDLQKEGFDQIEITLNEENAPKEINIKKDKSEIKSDGVKTISGGVVNGKATNLVKPAYPAAAKAVHASGAVNVEVTIDENGDVISASAVSGHSLLRSSAEQAARASKFAPTKLGGETVRVAGIVVYNFTPE
jgi:TonB family protein